MARMIIKEELTTHVFGSKDFAHNEKYCTFYDLHLEFLVLCNVC